jgi:hypothetical protein
MLDEGMIYEQPWHTFRLGHLKRADNELAALELAAWAREHHIQISFELRRVEVCGVGNLDVIYLVMKAREH